MLSGKVAIKENFTEKTNQTGFDAFIHANSAAAESYSQCMAERLSASCMPEIKPQGHI